MTLDQYVVPEMLRTRLEEVVLQIKILELGRASSFLSRVLEPPSEESIRLALNLLVRFKCYFASLSCHLLKPKIMLK